jgi:sporulation protein YlmC with PRC-barrel domain
MDGTQPARAEVLRTKDFVGWPVSDSRGAKVGTVDDILIDRNGKVRFLSVGQGLFRRRVLLPVDALSWGNEALVLGDWTEEQLKGLPPYDHDVPLTQHVLEEMERAFPRFYGPRGASAPPAALDAHIVPLSQAKGFRLSGGSPDLTGWHVFGSDGERAGTVAGMLVDPVAMSVRYIAVRLADDLFHLSDERMVIVPTERVDLRERGNDVWVNGLGARELARLPAYIGGALDPLVMQHVDQAFAAAPQTSAPDDGASRGAAADRVADPGAPIFGGSASGDRSEAETVRDRDVRTSGDDHLLPGDGDLTRTQVGGDAAQLGQGLRPEEEFRTVRPEDGPIVSDAPAAPPLPSDALPPPPDQRGDGFGGR